MVTDWTATVGALKAAGADVIARCSRCDTNRKVNLDDVIAEKGPLFTLWNKSPPCPAEGCTDHVRFQATIPDAGVWPTHMWEGEPGRVLFLEERWRADRLNKSGGAEVALHLVIAVIREMTRFGAFQNDDRRRLINDVVQHLPLDRQEDARWLLEHYMNLGQPRPGWA